MRIAVLSDARYPSHVDYPGHGLGRAAARLSTGLSRLGHQVDLWALKGSYAHGVNLIAITDEGDLLKLDVSRRRSQYDVIIDSTHEFKTMYYMPDFPMVAKICDREGVAPRNSVYGSSAHALLHSDPDGLVIPEGLDIDTIPFNEGEREDCLVWSALKVGWKKPEKAIEIADTLQYPILMIGDGELSNHQSSYVVKLPAIAPPNFYGILSRSLALVSCVTSMSQIEAAATGTQTITLVDDEYVNKGVTGDLWDGILHEYTPKQRRTMREWVAEERSIQKMALAWENILYRTIGGETWR